MKDEKKIQSHGLTVEEMEELKYKQQMNEVEKVEANKDSSFEIPANEQHLIHAQIEIKQFDSATGEKTSVPKVQTFYPKEFKDMIASGGFKGYSVTVVHDPSKEEVEKKVSKKSASKVSKETTSKEAVEKPLSKKELKEIEDVKAEYLSLYGEVDEDLNLEDMKDLIKLKKEEK